MPFYPGDEGSLSYNTNISLDGSTPHIKEITFAGTSNDTYAGGDVVQVRKKITPFTLQNVGDAADRGIGYSLTFSSRALRFRTTVSTPWMPPPLCSLSVERLSQHAN